jgi:PAS domain S-box-containing protein
MPGARSSHGTATQMLSAAAAGQSGVAALQSLLQTLHVGVLLSGPDGKVTFTNRAVLEMCGFEEKDILGKTPEEINFAAFGEDGSPVPPSKRPLALAIQTKKPVVGQLLGWQFPKLKRALWTVVSAVPQLAPDGGVEQVITTLTDITAQKDAEAALRRASELNRQIVESAQEGIIVHDRHLRYVLWNPYMEEMTGLKESDVVGRNPLDIFPFMAENGLYEGLQRALLGETFSLEYLPFSIRSTNRSGWCSNRAGPLRDAAGEIVGVIATVGDVTERRRTEERLRAGESLLAQSETLANMGSWETSLDGMVMNWSPHYYRMLGLDPVAGPMAYDEGITMIHPEDRDRAVRDMDRLINTHQPLDNELRFIRRDGALRVFHSRAVALTDKTGRVVSIQGMSQDVTEKRSEDERLKRSEALLSQAEQIADFGSWETDLRTGETTLSRNLLHIYGLTSETEWNREAFWSRVHPDDRERARQLAREAVAECKPFEFVVRYRKPDGAMRVIFSRAVQVAGTDGHAERSIGVARDITDQVQTEEDLRQVSSRLLRLQEEERRRIARELHDSVSQKLLTVSLNLTRMKEAGKARAKLPARVLQETQRTIKDLSKEVRSLTYLLHPPFLDELGLAAAIEEYVRGFSQRSGIHLEFEAQSKMGRIPKESETALFRIVQEALGNIQKHSGSATGRIRLRREGDVTILEITDQGRGMPRKRGRKQKTRTSRLGVGILGMRERMRQLGGRLDIASDDSGTTVTAILPAREEDVYGGSHTSGR